ncbi:sarcolemma associated protein b isoform 3-T5 [Synchiropus picturatus]
MQMDEKKMLDPHNDVSLRNADHNKANMGSSGDSEKVIQRLNDELQEAREQANTEKKKCNELQGILEEAKKDGKQLADESANQKKLLNGQLKQLQDEIDCLKEQLDVSSGSHKELQRVREEVKSLQCALDTAAAERDRDVSTVRSQLATVSKDLDKWRQTALKYERDIGDLQQDLQQQSNQWQKTAEIQASELQSMQAECNGLQKECSSLRSEKQDMVTKHQKENSGLQRECASLRAEKEELLKAHEKEKASLQKECAALRTEKEAAVEKQLQLERDLVSSRTQNTELSDSLKALERSQQELEKKIVALQLQHQQDSTKLQTQLDEADMRSKVLHRECDEVKTELSDLKIRYETTEKEKQLLSSELEECKASMMELKGKGTQYEVAKDEITNLKIKYEMSELEKQLLSIELEEVKAVMQECQGNGVQKSWMIWGPVVAVALTAVTAAALFRT